MNREYYFSTIKDFISTNPTSILGELMVHDEFKTTDQQKNAWLKEISILQNQLTDYPEGEISFEYTIPRIGHRIDTRLTLSISTRPAKTVILFQLSLPRKGPFSPSASS